MLIEDPIIAAYCVVDGLLKKIVGNKRLRERGFEPCLSDSKVITMEIIAEFLSIDTNKGS